MFEPTYSDKNDRPHISEFNAFMSGATKSPYQCEDTYGVYKSQHEQRLAQWNREHPNDRRQS